MKTIGSVPDAVAFYALKALQKAQAMQCRVFTLSSSTKETGAYFQANSFT